MLVVKRNVYESIRCNDDITITVLGIQGEVIRFGITALSNTLVCRNELYQQFRQRVKSNSVERS